MRWGDESRLHEFETRRLPSPMDIDITLKNFRCFADRKPAKFSLRSNGFTGFVGVNNSGKSSLLKMFFELLTGKRKFKDDIP